MINKVKKLVGIFASINYKLKKEMLIYDNRKND